MPPKKNTEADGSATSLSETETRFLKAMFDHMNSRPDIDWDKVATDLGMTAKSAKERFRVLGKRHNWGTSAAGAGGSNGSPAKGPLTPKNASKVAKKATPQKKGIARKKVRGLRCRFSLHRMRLIRNFLDQEGHRGVRWR